MNSIIILRLLYIFIYLRLLNDVNNIFYNFNLLNLSKKRFNVAAMLISFENRTFKIENNQNKRLSSVNEFREFIFKEEINLKERLKRVKEKNRRL